MNEPNKPVLITSASVDEHAFGPVSRILEHSGYPVVVYLTDRLLSCEDLCTIDVTDEGGLTINYNGTSILPEALSAAWYRKIGSFALPEADKQIAKQLYMNNEVRWLHDTIWPVFYPEDLWLSSPNNLARADRKLGQLLVAHEVGFSIPETLVGSDWEAICAKLLPSGDDRMIIKMMRGVISSGETIRSMPTTIVGQPMADTLRTYTTPFPGLYQPYIPKAREWRVTVVGSNVFPAAIYTDETAKDDWRRLQNTSAVEFRSEQLPEGVDVKCVLYLQKMGLRFGAFDLVETPDGEIVFLECNPNGQYGWLEEDLGLPISGAIASELIKIAEKRRGDYR